MTSTQILTNTTITINPVTFIITVRVNNYYAPPEYADNFLTPLLEERIFSTWGNAGYVGDSLQVNPKLNILEFRLSHGDAQTIQWALNQIQLSEAECE